MARHHFVPQFYLRGFVDPSSEGSRNPYLWLVDLQNQTLERRAPKNAASITGFYDWERLGGNAPSLENLYSQIESKTAGVISALRAHNFELSLQDRYDLSKFLGFQLTRVPRFRKAAEAGLRKHAQDWLQDFVQNEELLQAKLEEYGKSREDSTLTVESIREFIEGRKYILMPDSDYVLGVTLRAGLDFTRVVFAMNWLYVVATEGASFFTSDQPVALLTPDAKPRKIDFRSGRNPELEISFPISPSCTLLLHQHKVPGNIVSVDKEQVRKINRRVFPTVDRYVFCSSKQLGEWVLE